MTLLVARDVSVAPPAAPDLVVRGVSLEVRSGEWVALTGPNGGGKTSLLLALGGLWPTREGEVTLDGRPLEAGAGARRALTESSRRAEIAVILQDPGVQMLQPTVAEELMFAARNLDRPEAEIRLQAERWIERLDLASVLGRDPRTLSAGQQQRVLVAAALIAAPRVLIADEPGAHLDPPTRGRVIEAIRDEVGRGLAVLWATQEAAELQAADRVVRLGQAPALASPGGDGVAGPSPPLLALEVGPWDGAEGPRVATSKAFEIAVASRGVTALTGPNGSGKSVILAVAGGWNMTPQVMARWQRPPSPPPIIAAQYPESQLFEEVVRDELIWAAASRGLDRVQALEVSAGYLEELGIDSRTFLTRRSWSLSGGEKRIAGIVGVLSAPAALRVLDEPTAGLDPARRTALGALLRRVSRAEPVLIASQDATWVSALASRAFGVGESGVVVAPSRSKKTD